MKMGYFCINRTGGTLQVKNSTGVNASVVGTISPNERPEQWQSWHSVAYMIWILDLGMGLKVFFRRGIVSQDIIRVDSMWQRFRQIPLLQQKMGPVGIQILNWCILHHMVLMEKVRQFVIHLLMSVRQECSLIGFHWKERCGKALRNNKSIIRRARRKSPRSSDGDNTEINCTIYAI